MSDEPILGYCMTCGLLSVWRLRACPRMHRAHPGSLMPAPAVVEAAWLLGGQAACVAAWKQHPDYEPYRLWQDNDRVRR